MTRMNVEDHEICATLMRERFQQQLSGVGWIKSQTFGSQFRFLPNRITSVNFVCGLFPKRAAIQSLE